MTARRWTRRKGLVPGIVLLALTVVNSLLARRPSRTVPGRATVIRRTLDATVSIRAVSGTDSVVGSGFLLAPTGVVATAAHVVDGASSIRVHRASGATDDVIGVYLIDRRYDFALLKIPGSAWPTVRLGNSDSVTVGERVVALGSPLGLEATVTDGLISAERTDNDRHLLQISVPVSPGSSGGPVLLEDGRVVGLVIAGIRVGGAENLNFALPINYVREALAKVGAVEPVPIAEAVTVTLGERTTVAREAVPSGATTSRTVNDSLAFDWTTLDGISIYSEDNDHKRTLRISTEYTMTRDVSGARVPERHLSIVWNQGYKDLFKDEYRTTLDESRSSREYFQRTSWDASVAGFSWEASAKKGEWRYSSEDHRTNNVALAAGALPPESKGSALAALPDSLPASVYIWFFGWDSTLAAQVVPIRFDFGQRGVVTVPVAKVAQPCGPRTPVDHRKVAVVWVTETSGAERDVYPVLASRPHLRVDPVGMKCVSLPGLATRH